MNRFPFTSKTRSLFFILSFFCVTACSESEEVSGSVSETTHNQPSITMNLEKMLNSGSLTADMSVGQPFSINSENEPRWQVSLGRKDQESVNILRSQQGHPVSLSFNRAGTFTLNVESFISRAQRSSGQMPNIQRFQLTINVK